MHIPSNLLKQPIRLQVDHLQAHHTCGPHLTNYFCQTHNLNFSLPIYQQQKFYQDNQFLNPLPLLPSNTFLPAQHSNRCTIALMITQLRALGTDTQDILTSWYCVLLVRHSTTASLSSLRFHQPPNISPICGLPNLLSFCKPSLSRNQLSALPQHPVT